MENVKEEGSLKWPVQNCQDDYPMKMGSNEPKDYKESNGIGQFLCKGKLKGLILNFIKNGECEGGRVLKMACTELSK